MSTTSSIERLQRQTDWLLNHPFHRFAGLELVFQEPGRAWCRFTVEENAINPSGMLHAGLLYGYMDTAAYFSVLPMLEEGEQATTIDLHASIIRVAPLGSSIGLRAEVIRRGASVAFVRCEAHGVEDGMGLIASATVTMAITKPRI